MRKNNEDFESILEDFSTLFGDTVFIYLPEKLIEEMESEEVQ